MPVELSGGYELSLSFPQRPDGYVILAVYALLALAALIGAWRSVTRLRGRQWWLFLMLLAASVLLNALLSVPLSLPGWPQTSSVPPTPLLGMFCVLLTGAWLGTGPATAAGLAAGLARWLFARGRITQPAEIALIGFLAAFLMWQRYRGRLGSLLRRPFAAGGVTAVVALFPTALAIYASAPGDSLSALDYTESLFLAAALPLFAEILLGALLAHLACLAFPSLRPSLPATETPIYARSFSRRVLLTILPITFVTISFQVFFVGATALGEARQQALAQLTRGDRKSVV